MIDIDSFCITCHNLRSVSGTVYDFIDRYVMDSNILM